MAKRRSNGEGSIQHRADGRWSVTLVTGCRPDGKPERKTIYGKTQKEATAAAKEYLDLREHGIMTNGRLTFGEWADKWYEDYRGSVRASTYENYRYTLQLCKKLFGHRRLSDIKAMDIEAGIKQLIAEDYGKSMICKVKAMLNQIFRKAEANGLIERNPVPLTEKTRIPKKADREGFLYDRRDSYSVTGSAV